MKRFNVIVIAAWLTIFLCSLRSNSGYPGDVISEPFGVGWLMDNTNYHINESVWSNCAWCAKPSEQVRVEVGTDANNGPVYAMQDEYGNLADSRMTLTILQNTFPLLLAFMFAINAAFYCGNGTIGRGAKTAMKTAATYSARRRAATKRIKREAEKEIAPSPSEMQRVIELN